MYQQQLDVSQAKDTPNIQYVLKPIMSAIETVKKQMTDDQLARSFIDEVTMMNVKNNIAYILKNTVMSCVKWSRTVELGLSVQFTM